MGIRNILVATCLGQMLSGCGSVQDSTPDRVEFDLPSVQFEFSGTDWHVPTADQIPNMVCAGPAALATDCCAPPEASMTPDCRTFPIACDPETNLCATIFDVSLIGINPVDLTTALAGVQGRVFSFVELVSLSTTVPALPIHAANLYVGPLSMVSAASPGATFVGQVDLQSASGSVPIGAEAEQAFSILARDYPWKFQFLLALHVQVPRGGTVPTGTTTLTLNGRATAYY